MNDIISDRNTFFSVSPSIVLLNSHKKLQAPDIHALLEKHQDSETAKY